MGPFDIREIDIFSTVVVDRTSNKFPFVALDGQVMDILVLFISLEYLLLWKKPITNLGEVIIYDPFLSQCMLLNLFLVFVSREILKLNSDENLLGRRYVETLMKVFSR